MRIRHIAHAGSKYTVVLRDNGDFKVFLRARDAPLFVGTFHHGMLDCGSPDLVPSLVSKIENALASLSGDPNAAD